jgi:hypothetical protein
VDSTALLTEPTLEAWGIPYAVLEPGREREMVVAWWNRAIDEDRPVALLLAHATA